MVTIKKVTKLIKHYRIVLGLDSWDIFAGVVPPEEIDGNFGMAQVLTPYQRATIRISKDVHKEMLRYTVVHELCHIATNYQSHIAEGLINTLPEAQRARELQLVRDAGETVTEMMTRAVLRAEGHR